MIQFHQMMCINICRKAFEAQGKKMQQYVLKYINVL